jgi:hypothetical protein
VADTLPPVITLTPDCGGGITQLADGSDPTPTATAVDLLDGAVPVNKGGDTVNPNPVFGSKLTAVFNLAYDATDAAGNTAVDSCKVTLGNPDPVAKLNGNSTVVVASGADYVEEGATCEDYTDGVLPDAIPDMIIDGTTPNGNYTITYTCGPNSLNNVGTAARQVLVGVAFSAASDSGSTFVMLDPAASFVGGADDVFFSWDGSLYTDPVTQTAPNMFMGSAAPQPFFGFPWDAHDIRAFGPGDYVIPTSRGNSLNLHIEPNQIGAHMLFDWNENNDIDVVLTWGINGVFVGSSGATDDLGSKGQSFGLAVIDADGDGISGTPMADGPFTGFNANFNIKLTPLFALPDATATAAQGDYDPVVVISTAGGIVTIAASVNPDVNGVFTYGTDGFNYDWSMTDAALLAAEVGGPSNTAIFQFNPASLTTGPVKAVVKVIDNATGLTSTIPVNLQVTTGPTDGDFDADGVPDSQDTNDNKLNPTVQQGDDGILLQSSAGTLILGDTAVAVGVSTGIYTTTLSGADLPPDPDYTTSCVGGCNNFTVIGITPGSAVEVTLPLTETIPDDGVVRKFINGAWRDFVTGNGNDIMSAPGAAGDCSAPGAFTPKATPGDFCLKLTLVDGGPNDADGVANGIVKDPNGVASGGAAPVAPPANVSSPDTGGCTAVKADLDVVKRSEWWLLAGFLSWLGWRRSKRKMH